MALFDFLKNKKDAERSRKPERKTAKTSVVPTAKQSRIHDGKAIGTKPEVKSISVSSKIRNAKFSYEAIKQPHISEKASDLAESNQYIFEISPNYNKNEIKNAIEGIYGVDVLSVHTIKIPAKKRRLGKTQGFRKAYKKAVVRIKDGQKIEIL